MRECYMVLNWLTVSAEAKRRGFDIHTNVSGFYLSRNSDNRLSRLFNTTDEILAFMDGMGDDAFAEAPL